MKKIAVIENGYVRDSQIYSGDPDNINDETDWESDFTDVKCPCQFIGIFEGVSNDEITAKAAECEGIHPGIVTLIGIDGN
jgi:hypothetical protein